jgi:pimeloyl-ACP methyl ester carboxylesterase
VEYNGIHTINGVNFNLMVQGKGSPLLLLHGGYTNLTVWDEHVEELARNYMVIRYDQRGYGKSDPVKAPSPTIRT